VVTLGILDDQLDSKLQTALQLMQLLFKVNLKSRHVPIAEFYNDAGMFLFLALSVLHGHVFNYKNNSSHVG
jgi:hypothetical protein